VSPAPVPPARRGGGQDAGQATLLVCNRKRKFRRASRKRRKERETELVSDPWRA
jgi:hypothetical protein